MGGYAAACVLFCRGPPGTPGGAVGTVPLAATALAAAALTGANLAVRELGMAQTERARAPPRGVGSRSERAFGTYDPARCACSTIHEGAVVRIDRRARRVA